MKICIFGLGYVGTVAAGCLAREGHEVIGVDPNRVKVDCINAGRSPIVEKDIGEILAAEVAAGRLAARTEAEPALARADIAFVCVGTPGQPNGALDLEHVRRVCEQIGRALRHHPGAPVVAVRSTMLPGSMREVVIPTLEAFSGRRAGVDFGVCMNPEFLREGSAVHDYRNPALTLIGELNRASGERLAALYAGVPAPVVRTDLRTAEMLKYAGNAWHALKVGFANEIGNLCKGFDVDAHRVMDIFCQDRKLNISPTYLRPGFAFGGSCLPKDLRALLHAARTHDVAVPILASILPSNQLQIERAVQAVVEQGRRRVGVLGVTFKAGTDDMRESPMVELAERLIGKGFDLRIYDRNVALASVHGANRDYILNRIPHISRLMLPRLDDVLRHAETIVVGPGAQELRDVPRRLGEGQVLVDLVRVCDARSVSGVYEGLCW